MLHEKSEHSSTPVSQIAIIEAFAGLEDPRRRAGQRHTRTLCLALFTLAIASLGGVVTACSNSAQSQNQVGNATATKSLKHKTKKSRSLKQWRQAWYPKVG